MTLLEHELRVGQNSQTTGAESLPQPLDQKIVGGLAIVPNIDQADLEALGRRLSDSFEALRFDRTREGSTCIAYGFGIGEEDETLIDERLINTAARQNHGLVSQRKSEGDALEALWTGKENERLFVLRKRANAWIPLDNGEIPTGTVYSLYVGAPEIFQQASLLRLKPKPIRPSHPAA